MSIDFDTGLDLSEEFIHSTLGAMRYGSLEATQYFPCLLHLDYSKNPKLEEKFECTSAEVETWMFLKWQAQLLSHIGTPISSLIAPILSRLAGTYPDPFVYAFRMTKEMNKSLSTDPTVRKLNEILPENNDLKHFLEAMKYVVQPELLLTYYLNELGLNMAQNPVVGRNTLLAHVYPDGNIPYQGCAYSNIAIFKGQIKDRTKPIKQMIDELKEELEIRLQGASDCELPLKAYSPWLDGFKGGNIEVPGQYTGDKKRDVLREAFKSVSSSPESFFAIRQNFITSYATMCIAQWILGIGDRNLENTLISYASGKVLGIDFGYSFDSSIDVCSVPELTPFRLTPQILMLLEPFDENGLLKITMNNVFRALKRGKDPLLACMDILIKEPLLDWLPERRAHQGQQKISGIKWYPKKKINIVKSKFNGAKPSHLTLQQLKDRYDGTPPRNKPYFQKCIDIVNGSDRDHPRVRSKYKNENLSTEEQIECLLDQATDPNILGRAYAGWQAWI